jgi:hypothetical protein
LAAWGFSAADFDEQIDVWPENLPAVDLFLQMQTQWSVGMAGPVGLRYEVLFLLMDRMGLSGRDVDWMFSDVRVMELAALEEMRNA